MKYIYRLLFSILTLSACGQEKEVLIIGTMHLVPEMVKDSYSPLLEFSKNYNPDAIYVEYVRSNDTISLINNAKEFIIKSDSLQELFVLNDKRFNELNNTDLIKFTKDDFEFMTKAHLVKKDKANYSYYNYLTQYGVEGSEEPTRHEHGDLTAKLAIALNLKYLYSMDDQTTRAEYHAAWGKCNELGAANGDNEISQKLAQEQYDSAVTPALAGRLGEHTNKLESLNRMHLLNSFRYVQNANSDCENATKYWDGRNYGMARNIAEQVRAGSNVKNIILVGAGHVIGLKEALEKVYPELNVRLMSDG